MHRWRWLWLACAAALLAAAAFLMSMGDEPKRLPPRVKMPRAMDPSDETRLVRRRTLPWLPVEVPATPAADATEPPARPRMSDPVLRAMPSKIRQAAIVIEASAVRDSPIGQLIVGCFTKSGGLELAELKKTLGIDPLVDLDRVSIFDDTFVISGQFRDAKWGEMFADAKEVAINDHTTLWELPSPSTKVSATWRNQLLITGGDRAAVEQTIARLEETSPRENPVITEGDSYGEAYGVVAPSAIAEMLARDQPALAERLRQVVSHIGLHVDASHDVGLVLDAQGTGPTQDTIDFGKAVGSAMALGRIAAKAQGNQNLAQILEYARVVPDPDSAGFRTELALPLAFFQEKLRDCAEKRPTTSGW